MFVSKNYVCLSPEQRCFGKLGIKGKQTGCNGTEKIKDYLGFDDDDNDNNDIIQKLLADPTAQIRFLIPSPHMNPQNPWTQPAESEPPMRMLRSQQWVKQRGFFDHSWEQPAVLYTRQETAGKAITRSSWLLLFIPLLLTLIPFSWGQWMLCFVHGNLVDSHF